MIGKFNEVPEAAKERPSLKDSPLGRMDAVKESLMPHGDYDPPPWKHPGPIFREEWKDTVLSQEDAPKHFAERMETRNQDLEGKEHPETGVPFEKKILPFSSEDGIATLPWRRIIITTRHKILNRLHFAER